VIAAKDKHGHIEMVIYDTMRYSSNPFVPKGIPRTTEPMIPSNTIATRVSTAEKRSFLTGFNTKADDINTKAYNVTISLEKYPPGGMPSPENTPSACMRSSLTVEANV
jgi:hypothetical protein